MGRSSPRIVIAYCTQCQWLLRAAWMAQELLSTFGTDLGEVALSPGTGGVFEITYDGTTIWERKCRCFLRAAHQSDNGSISG
jgi:selenoprotein W-related protein